MRPGLWCPSSKQLPPQLGAVSTLPLPNAACLVAPALNSDRPALTWQSVWTQIPKWMPSPSFLRKGRHREPQTSLGYRQRRSDIVTLLVPPSRHQPSGHMCMCPPRTFSCTHAQPPHAAHAYAWLTTHTHLTQPTRSMHTAIPHYWHIPLVVTPHTHLPSRPSEENHKSAFLRKSMEQTPISTRARPYGYSRRLKADMKQGSKTQYPH